MGLLVGHCRQRWQCATFMGWLFPAVGLVNVRIAFCEVALLPLESGEQVHA